MNFELIKITENDGVQTVSGRELHRTLGIKTDYTHWFSRMCEYGFVEGEDFQTFLSESTGGRPATDHIIKLDMAKEISMIQNTPIGRQMRKYFIAAENQYRALQTAKSEDEDYLLAQGMLIAGKKIERLQAENTALTVKVEEQDQQIALMEPKVNYCDVVLNTPDLISVTSIAKDYGWSAKKLNKTLCNLGIQFWRGGRWYLYQKYASEGYTDSKTIPFPGKDGTIHSTGHTYWTQKGRLFIYEQLKACGIVPVSEQPKQLSLPVYDFGEVWS